MPDEAGQALLGAFVFFYPHTEYVFVSVKVYGYTLLTYKQDAIASSSEDI